MELKGGAIGIQGRIAVCGCLCLGGPLRLSILLIGRYGASGGRYAAAPACGAADHASIQQSGRIGDISEAYGIVWQQQQQKRDRQHKAVGDVFSVLNTKHAS